MAELLLFLYVLHEAHGERALERRLAQLEGRANHPQVQLYEMAGPLEALNNPAGGQVLQIWWKGGGGTVGGDGIPQMGENGANGGSEYAHPLRFSESGIDGRYLLTLGI